MIDELNSTAIPGSVSQPLTMDYMTSTEILGNVPSALAVVADEFDSTRSASPPVMFVKIEIGFNSNDWQQYAFAPNGEGCNIDFDQQ